MHEYDDQIRPTVVLRRIIIVVAVLTAVPVALWTLTAFVRSYVAPPKLPTFARVVTPSSNQGAASTGAVGQSSLWQDVTTFVGAHSGMLHFPAVSQLAAMVMKQVPGSAMSESRTTGSLDTAAAHPAAASAPMTVEARATATDAREASTVVKDQTAGDVAASVGTAAASPAPPSEAGAAEASASLKSSPSSPASWPPAQQQNGTPKTDTSWPPATATATPPSALGPPATLPITAENTAQPASSMTPSTSGPLADDAGPAAQSLTGRIPLPRRRPSDQVMVQITAANVPMPRPRPDAAGSVASDRPAAPPLDFFNNLFH